MLVCIEGPSAVGKTSICKLLEKNNDAYIVEETIFRKLDGYSLTEQALYYLQKELERWNIAQEKLKTHPLVVLDSDPLKPLWFNWSFSFIDCLSLSELDNFFRSAIINEKLGYPDGYILLTTDEQELYRRKNEDKRRKRPEFEQLLCINEPRKRYYCFINSLIPGSVKWIDATDINTTFKLSNTIIQHGFPIKNCQNEEYFTKTINWIGDPGK